MGVSLGGEGFSVDDQIALNKRMSEQARQREADIQNVKENLYKNDSGQTASRVRGLGPAVAERRLKESGVDTESLMGRKKGGAIDLKDCKVSTAPKGKKNAGW